MFHSFIAVVALFGWKAVPCRSWWRGETANQAADQRRRLVSDNFKNQSEEELVSICIDVFWVPLPFALCASRTWQHNWRAKGYRLQEEEEEEDKQAAELRFELQYREAVSARDLSLLPPLWILQVDKRDKDKELKSALPNLTGGADTGRTLRGDAHHSRMRTFQINPGRSISAASAQKPSNPGTRATGEEPPAAQEISDVCAARKARRMGCHNSARTGGIRWQA